jgi:hypothetical protein
MGRPDAFLRPFAQERLKVLILIHGSVNSALSRLNDARLDLRAACSLSAHQRPALKIDGLLAETF